MIPISQLAQLITDIPFVHNIVVRTELHRPTILWSNTGLTESINRAALRDKISENELRAFSIFLTQCTQPFPLVSLDFELPFFTPELIKKAPGLKKLRLKNLAEEKLEPVLAEVGRCCPLLQELTLPYFNQLSLIFLDNTIQLSKLVVNYCRNVTWFTKPQMKIDFLDCSYCQNMTEKMLKAILQNTPNLSSLNISGCPLSGSVIHLMTGSKIQTLWMHEIALELEVIEGNKEFLSQLKLLGLVNCHLNSEACHRLAVYAYQLTNLDLRDNPGILVEEIKFLVTQLERLMFLNIMGSSLTPNQIGELKKMRPGLKITT